MSLKQFFFTCLAIAIASCISLIGGFGLEAVESSLLPLVPLVIAIPALSTLASDYSAIVASHAADPNEQKETKKELAKAVVKTIWINIGGILAFSVVIGAMRGYDFNNGFLIKFTGFLVSSIIFTVLIVFILTIILDRKFEQNKIDQNEIFIPIISSISNVAILGLIALAALFLF